MESPAGLPIVVEFTDYQCPFCIMQHAALTRLRDSAMGVALRIRHFPLPIHRAAPGAARAAICAGRQGRFTQMHDRLYTTRNWQRDTNWVREAHAAGVSDLTAFAACLQDPATGARLAGDRAWADSFGIRATPSFVHPHGVHEGLLRDSALKAIVAKSRR